MHRSARAAVLLLQRFNKVCSRRLNPGLIRVLKTLNKTFNILKLYILFYFAIFLPLKSFKKYICF